MRHAFYLFCIFSLTFIGAVYFIWPPVLYFLFLVIPIIVIGFLDIRSTHSILRNYPVLGHLRYMFEFIRPEIQQYFVATNLSGRPYSREKRSLIYQRAKNVMDTHPFGTEHDINAHAYEFANHSIQAKKVHPSKARILVGGPQCEQPYEASIMNVSAMSYGSLSRNAIRAISLGTKKAGIYQNTGEGSITPHHLFGGNDLVWQIGTGYFGCRTSDGNFDKNLFKEKANSDVVKMIEIKISQGAKPSHGGILPGAKVTAEIAEIRGIPLGEDCLSPPGHKTFDTPRGLLRFIDELRTLSNGKPIGFKIAVGIKKEFLGICKAMLDTHIYPDFITVDGAEGGTGAAPLVFTNRLGMPSDEALAFVHNALVACNLREHINIICSGKVVSGFDIVKKLALGANMVNLARPFMFAVGCIQAMKCNTNECPTGVTSNDPGRYSAIDIESKADHVYHFHRNTVKGFLELAGAMGIEDPQQLTPDLIHYRIHEGHSKTLADLYCFVEPGHFFSKTIHPAYKAHWEASSADHF